MSNPPRRLKIQLVMISLMIICKIILCKHPNLATHKHQKQKNLTVMILMEAKQIPTINLSKNLILI